MCNFSLTAVFLFCTMLKVKSVAETLEAGEMYDRLYFDEFLIGGCLFICIVASLCVACALSVQTIYEAAQVPTFRLLSTSNRPELATNPSPNPNLNPMLTPTLTLTPTQTLTPTPTLTLNT